MSFGSVIGAIISQRNNKKAKSSKIDRYFNNTGSKFKGLISHREPTPEEIKELKRKLTAQNKKHQQKVILLTIAVMLLLLLLFVYIMFFWK